MGVSALLLWLGICACVAAGYGSTDQAITDDVAAWYGWVIVACLLGGGLCHVWGAVWPARANRWRTGLVLGLVGGLAWVHGASGPIVSHGDPGIPGRDRGPVDGLRELVVTGASAPGFLCHVVAREPETDVEVLVTVPPTACPLAQGQRIGVLTRELIAKVGPQLPGDPEPTARARASGASFEARLEHVWPAGGVPSRYWQKVARLRHWAFDQARGSDALGFVAAATLGIRTALSPDRRTALRRAGLGHLVAVSGVHVGIAAWLAYVVVLRLMVGLGSSVGAGIVASWVPVLVYVGITGGAPPAVRAAVMVILLGLSVLAGRPAHGLVTLAVAAATLLVFRPAWAFDAGFHLSLAAMAVLVRQPPKIGWIATSWRVTWAIAPVSLLHFGDVCVIGVLANLIAIPLFALWILPLGLLGWSSAPWFGTVTLIPACWGADLLLDWAAWVAALPTIPIPWVAGVAIAAFLFRWFWIPRVPARPWHRYVPPWLASLGLLGAMAHARLVVSSPPPPGTWFALGGSHAPSVLRVSAGHDACLEDPRWTPERWRTVLAALGIRHLRLTSTEEPHVRALADDLRRAGHTVTVDRECRFPPRRTVRSALRACENHFVPACVAVRVDPAANQLACFCQGAWRRLGRIQSPK